MEIGTTREAWGAGGPGIAPGFVAMSGYVLAWRRDGGLEVQVEDGYPALPTVPLMRGRVTIDADRRDRLRARLRGRRPVGLGDAIGPCISSSGCSGVDRIQLAGRFAGVRSWYADPAFGDYSGSVAVVDLRTGERRRMCRSTLVARYVLSGAGAIACLVHTDTDVQEIRAEGTLLDSGPGLTDLRRRGDELVWMHDAQERTAPLPRRG